MAGGIPVLRALQEGLAGDRLVEVRGILNGTCAYILSRMQSEPISFADALAEAQQAGYAEADPSEDVDGADAAAKLAIIAAVGLRRPVRVGDIATRSIRPIERSTSNTRASSAAPSGRSRARRPKTTARCSRPSGRRWCRCRSGFGRIEGSQNLVTVRGIFGGETSFSGSGAGGSPTAVAVVSDVLSVAARGDAVAAGQRRGADDVPRGQRRLRRAALRALHRQRQAGHPRAGLTAAYARYGINIEGVLQLPQFRKDRLPFVTTLEECPESVLDRALAEVAEADYHVQPPLALPIFLR